MTRAPLSVAGPVSCLLLCLTLLVVPQLPSPASAAATSVGTYNVQLGHPVRPHVTMILRQAKRHHLEVLALQEARGYVRALQRRAPRAGYQVVTCRDRQNPFLVRSHLAVEAQGCFRPAGAWYSPDGERRRTHQIGWIRVDGTTYVSVHAPVHAWVGRCFCGPDARRAAYREFIRDVRRFAAHHRPYVVLGDWNARPWNRGRWSPNHLRRSLEARWARPHRGTGHGEIDYAITKGSPDRKRPGPAGPADRTL